MEMMRYRRNNSEGGEFLSSRRATSPVSLLGLLLLHDPAADGHHVSEFFRVGQRLAASSLADIHDLDVSLRDRNGSQRERLLVGLFQIGQPLFTDFQIREVQLPATADAPVDIHRDLPTSSSCTSL